MLSSFPAAKLKKGKDLLTTRWESVKTLPNTQSNHILIVIDKHIIEYASYAQSHDHQQFKLVKANTCNSIHSPVTEESEVLETPSTSESTNYEDADGNNIRVGQWCVVRYDEELFAGEVKEIGIHRDYSFSYVLDSNWKWPSSLDDQTLYFKDKIVMLLEDPVIANNRGHFKFTTKF